MSQKKNSITMTITQEQQTNQQYALARLGKSAADMQTMTLEAARIILAPAAEVWEELTTLENWKSWQGELVLSARWTKGRKFEEGAEFEQLLQLGFPLGKTISRERVGESIPGELLAWWKEENGVASCHVWRLESLAPDATLVTNTEVFAGKAIPFLRPLVAGRWQRAFDCAVAGLEAQFNTSDFEINEKAPVTGEAWLRMDAPAEKVWSVLTDVENWPAWQSAVSQATLNGPVQKGTTFDWKANGMNIHSEFTVVKPTEFLTWKGRMLWIDAVHAWRFLPLDDGSTVVVVKESLEGAGIRWIFGRQKLKDSLEASLEELRGRVIEG